MVALHLDNSAAKVYLYIQSGTVSFSFQASLLCIESGWKAWYYFYSDIHTYPSQCGSQLSWERLFPEWHSLPCIAKAAYVLLGQMEKDLLVSWCTYQCQCYYTLENSLSVGSLGLNNLNHSWTYQVRYVFPPTTLVPLYLSKFLSEHVTSQFRLLFIVAPCYSSQYVRRLSSYVSCSKWLHQGCFSIGGTQGSTITAPWLLRDMLYR